ncbi:hypothetical protein DUNSADRAFT_15300 [Dunaliella salina]|uniref:Encoded protein n=1 Tax=Dunaliella salina TaxID=3046 RepID=A0ABQ7G5P7_DUNSA|nr:hypothetical protein DUNSADRAFT_15300 [Dunaliella salina]|eukprot:KAF5829920.1 hypothetical protein DUNSADRAFT_15300 [Dunaliella salina]
MHRPASCHRQAHLQQGEAAAYSAADHAAQGAAAAAGCRSRSSGIAAGSWAHSAAGRPRTCTDAHRGKWERMRHVLQWAADLCRGPHKDQRTAQEADARNVWLHRCPYTTREQMTKAEEA